MKEGMTLVLTPPVRGSVGVGVFFTSALTPTRRPGQAGAVSLPLSGGGGGCSHDPVSRHRPEGRAVRHGCSQGDMARGDRVQRGSRRRRRLPSRRRTSSGSTSWTSTARLPASRSMRGAVEAILEAVHDPGAARRRHPRPRHASTAWLDKGVVPRDPRHGGACAIPKLVRDGRARPSRAALPSASTRATARSRSRVGPRRREMSALELARALRGRRRRGHYLHRHRARRRAPGPQSRRDRRARPTPSPFRSSPVRRARRASKTCEALLEPRYAKARRRGRRPRAL